MMTIGLTGASLSEVWLLHGSRRRDTVPCCACPGGTGRRFFFFLRKENLATLRTQRGLGPPGSHKTLPQQIQYNEYRQLQKPQCRGHACGNSQRLPQRAAPAAGSRRVRRLAERVRGSGCARPSEVSALITAVHVSRGRAMCALSEPICTRKMLLGRGASPRGPLGIPPWTFEEHLREELRTLGVIIDVP